MNVSRVLLVGINNYPGARLNGCVNDVRDMRDMLMQGGVAASAIRVITDGRATTAAILERLRWLMAAPAGSNVLFHFSGHGVQVADRNRDEVDKLDEAICPLDFDWTPDRMITDDTFQVIFSSRPDLTVFWVSDSCHSGDLTRGGIFGGGPTVDSSLPRRYPTPIDFEHRAITYIERVTVPPKKDIPKSVVLLSGCRSDQTSADAYIDGRYNGALTSAFLGALASAPEATMLELRDATRATLKARRFSQVPQLEVGEASNSGRKFLA